MQRKYADNGSSKYHGHAIAAIPSQNAHIAAKRISPCTAPLPLPFGAKICASDTSPRREEHDDGEDQAVDAEERPAATLQHRRQQPQRRQARQE